MRKLLKQLIKDQEKTVIEIGRNMFIGWVMEDGGDYITFKIVVDNPAAKDTYLYYIPKSQIVYIRKFVSTEIKVVEVEEKPEEKAKDEQD